MRKILTFSLVILSSFHLRSQMTVNYVDTVMPAAQQQIDHVLEYISLTEASSNILIENGYPLVDPGLFDGSATAEIADKRTFGLAYATMRTAAVNLATALPEPLSAYTTEANGLGSGDPIPIAMLHYDYHRVDPDALDDGKVIIQNGQLQYGPNYNNNLMVADRCFVASPLVSQVDQATVTFIPRTQHYFSNVGTNVATLQVDFDNGQGFQTLTFDQTTAVTWSAPASQHLQCCDKKYKGSVIRF